MNKKLTNELKIPRWDELPEIDLYMDQLLSFIRESIGAAFDEIGYAPLTANMVNNYVKARIVEAPKNKR